MPLKELSTLEARVLGVLAEKQRTVPDSYPLTLNSLVAGCNQKSSRNPVLNASESEVTDALDNLRGMSLIVETSGGRAMRYAHNPEKVLQIPTQATAILAMTMLRGPQTPGELRINCERLHRFADISSVESFLEELAGKGLMVELPRQPGSRENRWMHLLSGTPEKAVAAAEESGTLEERVASLEREVAELRELVLGLIEANRPSAED